MKSLKIITSMSTALILCWSMGAFANPGLGTKLKRKKMKQLTPVSAPKTSKGKKTSKSKTKSKLRLLSSIARCESRIKATIARAPAKKTTKLRAVYGATQKTCTETKSCFSGCDLLRSACKKSAKAQFDCNKACAKAKKDKSGCKTACNKERKSFLSRCKQGPKGCKKKCRTLRSSRSCRTAMKSVIGLLKKSKLKGRKKAYSICKKAYKL